jgi:hypothetical protein
MVSTKIYLDYIGELDPTHIAVCKSRGDSLLRKP